MGVQEEVLTFYETALAPWGHAIGAGLCALGLLFLKLKKCAPTGCCSACLQVILNYFSSVETNPDFFLNIRTITSMAQTLPAHLISLLFLDDDVYSGISGGVGSIFLHGEPSTTCAR